MAKKRFIDDLFDLFEPEPSPAERASHRGSYAAGGGDGGG